MPVGCQVFLPAQPFNREFALATTAWQVISTFSSKYLLIISVTLSIVCGPYRFGDSIADSQIELRKTILYTLESYPAFLVLGVTVPLPSFGAELLAALFVLWTVCWGFITHWALTKFDQTQILSPGFGTVGAYLYWCGFTLMLWLPFLF